jgi:hypothetical protein
MKIAGQNKGLDLSPSVSRLVSQDARVSQPRYAQMRDAWTWRTGEPVHAVEWDDFGDLNLVECGRLARLHFRAPRKGHPRRDRDTMFELARPYARRSFLAFDADHPHQRLYLCVAPEATPYIAQRFWAENSAPAMPLGHAAALAGGRHGKSGDYPDVMVKPVGLLTAIVYHTHKNGDGPSYYIHQMAEESCHYPFLAADAQGRFWVAGGNYTCPVQGITD